MTSQNVEIFHVQVADAHGSLLLAFLLEVKKVDIFQLSVLLSTCNKWDRT